MDKKLAQGIVVVLGFFFAIVIFLIVMLFQSSEKHNNWKHYITVRDTVYLKPVMKLYRNDILITTENWELVDLSVCPVAAVNKDGILNTIPLLEDSLRIEYSFIQYDKADSILIAEE